MSTNPNLEIVYFLTVNVELVMATTLEENGVTEPKNNLTKPTSRNIAYTRTKSESKSESSNVMRV